MFKVFIICAATCCMLFAVSAMAKPPVSHPDAGANSSTADPNDGVPPEEISKDVSAVHVFVCVTSEKITRPDWLDDDALVKWALSYSKGHLNIPSPILADVRACNEQSKTTKSNELNIVLSLTGQRESYSCGQSDVVVLQRSFYRPVSDGGGLTFQTKPLVLDLSDDKAALDEFRLWNWYWADSRRHNNPLNADRFRVH